MVTFKLIQLYPGSKPLGYILKPVNNGLTKPDNYYQNGIWFNPSDYPKYWQEIKELTLLEEAKLRYPIGTKFKNSNIQNLSTAGYITTIVDHNYFEIIGNNQVEVRSNGTNSDSSWTLYLNNTWAEIIDDFVLPEKWCIKQNISKEVCDWFNKNGTSNANINGSWTYLNYPRIDGYYSSEINPGFTEITFEQFKKYVLKEETTVNVEEKVVEKDYEILSVLLQRSDKHQIHNVSEYKNTGYIKALLNCNGNKIHSVKRLSDSEIFTIGDKCSPIGKYRDNIHSITKIWFCNPGYLRLSSNNYTLGIKDIQKVKIPLFTSEDGVNIFEGDYSYGVHNSKFDIVAIKHVNTVYVTDNFIEFSTKEKAEEYILMNKPLLSLSDVWDNLKVKDQKEVMKFVKSKLNK